MTPTMLHAPDDWFAALLLESEKYRPCMSLSVCSESKSVELILDTSIDTYSEWIPGEGGDICLLRSQETKRVVGCFLPLLNERLSVNYDGPLKINDGFLKTED